ncbi:MAG TPA: FAD/NAD(P)-binding oxidoreductase [Candidatus Limnocylindrales bacterium]|nr:FAD/NAD(P)-binding oxidoreductase [Candidatus Limnocylindrales bacterium]
MARTVLVLGGGVGGIVAANELRRRLEPADRLIVIEREARYLFQASLLWLAVGRRRPQDVSRPTEKMLAPGIELTRAEVLGVDPVARSVETSAGALRADALLVALGVDLAPDAIDGYGDAAHNIFSADGAMGCARALDGFRGGRLVVAVSGVPYKCPAAPYEAALLLDDELRRRGVRGSTEIDLYTPEPQPMPVAGPAMGEAVVGLLEARSIRFHANAPIERFEPGAREIVLADGARVTFDLLAAVPPHRPPAALRDSGIVNEAGWVAVDRQTLQTAWEGVYAVGDATSITLANGKPLPKAGVFAHAEALVAAGRLAAGLGRSPTDRVFDGTGYCWLEAGAGTAAFAAGDFFAEPDPVVVLRRPNRAWHAGKVLFERYWLSAGLERRLSAVGLAVAARLLGLRVEL